jgi:zinc protease
MNSPDRLTAPLVQNQFTLPAIPYVLHELSNGVKVYEVNTGSQEVSKIEFVFGAGTWFENQHSLASVTNRLMREGTTGKSSEQVAEWFDFYGAYFESACARDTAVITLFSQNNHLQHTLPLFAEVIEQPAFSKEELDIYIANKIQKLRVGLQKVDFLARNEFPALLFGEQHPYGSKQSEGALSAITTESLKKFHQEFYLNNLLHVVVAGRVSSEDMKLILDNISAMKLGRNGREKHHELLVIPPQKKLMERNEVLQSALRLGRRVVNRHHPDYPELQVLNTVFGGYFGSRLMSNIREDKGYTYGIGSSLQPYLHDGIWIISTEVGTDVARAALDEIYLEMNRLSAELIPTEELKLVKNYLLGNLLKGMDGPFALSEKLNNLLLFGLSEDYYNRYQDKVRTVTSERLQELAKRYLQPEQWTELVVGKI